MVGASLCWRSLAHKSLPQFVAHRIRGCLIDDDWQHCRRCCSDTSAFCVVCVMSTVGVKPLEFKNMLFNVCKTVSWPTQQLEVAAWLNNFRSFRLVRFATQVSAKLLGGRVICKDMAYVETCHGQCGDARKGAEGRGLIVGASCATMNIVRGEGLFPRPSRRFESMPQYKH